MVPVATALSPGEDQQLRHVGRDPAGLVTREDFGCLDYRTFPPNCSMNVRAVVSSLIRSRVRHIRTAGVGEAMTIAQGVHFRKRDHLAAWRC
jgi:hypothetical protein